MCHISPIGEMMNGEKARLEEISRQFSYSDGFNGALSGFIFRTFQPLFRGRRCLEIGCADGKMTAQLVKCFDRVVSVDGAQGQIDRLKERVKAVNLIARVSLIEDLVMDERFDTVIASCFLEHVADPVATLVRIRTLMGDEGCLLIAVPNANSIHRKVGKYMGILKNLTDLSELDLHDGNRRTYTFDLLKKDILSAELKIKTWGGVFFKPLTSGQIERFFTDSMLEGFYQIGKEFPGYCSTIYAEVEK